MRNLKTALFITFIIFLQAAPYWVAITMWPDKVFTGVLFNPVDGNSYLAKMFQGWSSSWNFLLPYSAQPGSGSYLFLFYLGLGHLARLIGLSLEAMFHLARIFASIFLLLSLWRFSKLIFKEDEKGALFGFVLASAGSGLGWLLLPTGVITSDVWVGEGFPFLSMYANPHFPLGLALMLWAIMPGVEKSGVGNDVFLFILGMIQSIIMPFGAVLVLVVLAFRTTFYSYHSWKLGLRSLSAYLVGSVPYMLYQISVIRSNSVLAQWNNQNQTPAAPLWDMVISFSPALIFAFFGGYFVIRFKRNSEILQLLAWLIAGLILIYLPFNLQRRFISGLYIPVAFLAVYGLRSISERIGRLRNWATALLLIFSIPTNLLVIALEGAGIRSADPIYYMNQDEKQGLDWIRGNTPVNSLIVSSPEFGLFIPAQTGRRVIYGHPFETIHADEVKQNLLDLFSGKVSLESFQEEEGGDYLFIGLREKRLGAILSPPLKTPVFSVGDVAIYKLRP